MKRREFLRQALGFLAVAAVGLPVVSVPTWTWEASRHDDHMWWDVRLFHASGIQWRWQVSERWLANRGFGVTDFVEEQIGRVEPYVKLVLA